MYVCITMGAMQTHIDCHGFCGPWGMTDQMVRTCTHPNLGSEFVYEYYNHI